MTFLVSGVTRLRLKLDDILAQYCKEPLKKLDKTAVLQVKMSASVAGIVDAIGAQILRLGVFELLEMKKPPHVINEYVQLAKQYGLSPLVNGILRSFQRDLFSGTMPPATNVPPSIASSCKCVMCEMV